MDILGVGLPPSLAVLGEEFSLSIAVELTRSREAAAGMLSLLTEELRTLCATYGVHVERFAVLDGILKEGVHHPGNLWLSGATRSIRLPHTDPRVAPVREVLSWVTSIAGLGRLAATSCLVDLENRTLFCIGSEWDRSWMGEPTHALSMDLSDWTQDSLLDVELAAAQHFRALCVERCVAWPPRSHL